MLNLSKETIKTWIKNENAFKQLAKSMKINTIKYDKNLDQEFCNYLINTDIIFNNKIDIDLSWNTGENEVKLFKNFLVEWIKMKKYPIFQSILIPETPSISYFLEPIYSLLKHIDEEKVLVSQWKFLSSLTFNSSFLFISIIVIVCADVCNLIILTSLRCHSNKISYLGTYEKNRLFLL